MYVVAVVGLAPFWLGFVASLFFKRQWKEIEESMMLDVGDSMSRLVPACVRREGLKQRTAQRTVQYRTTTPYRSF